MPLLLTGKANVRLSPVQRIEYVLLPVASLILNEEITTLALFTELGMNGHFTPPRMVTCMVTWEDFKSRWRLKNLMNLMKAQFVWFFGSTQQHLARVWLKLLFPSLDHNDIT